MRVQLRVPILCFVGVPQIFKNSYEYVFVNLGERGVGRIDNTHKINSFRMGLQLPPRAMLSVFLLVCESR